MGDSPDPSAIAPAKEALPAAVEYAATPMTRARGADAVLLLTDGRSRSTD